MNTTRRAGLLGDSASANKKKQRFANYCVQLLSVLFEHAIDQGVRKDNPAKGDVRHAGIVSAAAGKVQILKRDDLLEDWDPQTDDHLTIWECLQYLIRLHEGEGLSENTAVLLKKIGGKAEDVKDLAYCLYDICANKRQDAKEATVYNALIADWSELTKLAASVHDVRGDGQTRMDV